MPNLPFDKITINGTTYETSKKVVTFANLTFAGVVSGDIKFSSDLPFDEALADFKLGKSLMVHTDYVSMFGDLQVTQCFMGDTLAGVGYTPPEVKGYQFSPFYDENVGDYDYNYWVCHRETVNPQP